MCISHLPCGKLHCIGFSQSVPNKNCFSSISGNVNSSLQVDQAKKLEVIFDISLAHYISNSSAKTVGFVQLYPESNHFHHIYQYVSSYHYCSPIIITFQLISLFLLLPPPIAYKQKPEISFKSSSQMMSLLGQKSSNGVSHLTQHKKTKSL